MYQMIQFLQKNGGEMLYKTWEHLYISVIAVLLGIIVAVPLGVLLTRMKKAQVRLSALSILFRHCQALQFWHFYSAARRGKGTFDRRAIFLFSPTDSKKYLYRRKRRQSKFAGIWKGNRYDCMGTNPPHRTAAVGSGDHGGHSYIDRVFNRLGDARFIYRRRRPRGLYLYRAQPLPARIYYRRSGACYHIGYSDRLFPVENRRQSHT